MLCEPPVSSPIPPDELWTQEDGAFQSIMMFGHGRYQNMMLLFSQLSFFAAICHNLSHQALAPSIDYWCKAPVKYEGDTPEVWKNATIPREPDGSLSRCMRYDSAPDNTSNQIMVPCNAWDYDFKPRGRTIVSEWNLVCDRAWLVPTLAIVYAGGSVITCPCVGAVADRIGRRPVASISLFVLMASDLATCFAKALPLFTFLRIVTSATVNAIQIVGAVLMFEVTLSVHRVLYCTLAASFALLLGPPYLALIANVVRDWNVAQLAIMAPTLLLILALYFTDESPRWLLTAGRIREVDQVVLWAARLNGVPLDQVKRQLQTIRAELSARRKEHEEVHLLLRRSRTIRIRSAVIFGCWFATFISFYILSLSKTYLDIRYIQVILMGIKIIFMTVNYFAMQLWSRRKTLGLNMFALSLLIMAQAAALFLNVSMLSMVVGLFTAIVMDLVMVTLFVYTTELFPTAIRSAGICWALFCGKIGAVMAPLVRLVASVTHPLFPFLVISITITTFALMALWKLPETSKRKPAESVKEEQDDKWKLQSPVRSKRKRSAAMKMRD